MPLSTYAATWCITELVAAHDLYVALSTTAPGPAGASKTEPGSNYGRVLLDDYTIVGKVLSNDVDVAFAVCAASWGTITYVLLMDAPTGGNMLAYYALVQGVPLPLGAQFRVSAGNMTFEFS